MRVWIKVLLGLAAGSLVGCSSLAGEYSTGPAKHPWVLQLEKDGSDELEIPRSSVPERGRWVELERRIVILAPDEPATDEHFALVLETPILSLRLYPTFRAALAAEKAFREVRRDAEGDEQ